MNNMYPFCEVLYKIIDEPGWFLGRFDGEKKIVLDKCKKLNWFKYIIYDGCSSAWRIKDQYPLDIDPFDMHLRSKWIFSNELKKIFLPDEIIPVPDSTAIFSDDFDISFLYKEEDNFLEDLCDIYEENKKNNNMDIVNTYPEIKFRLQNNDYIIQAEYSSIIHDRLIDFINKIRNNLFSYLIIDEYNYIKLLSWSISDMCRIKIQNYDDNHIVVEPMDFIINKECCIKKFSIFKNKIETEHKKIVLDVTEVMKKNV